MAAGQTQRVDGNGNIVVQAVESTVTITGAPPATLTLVPWHRRPREVKSDLGLLDPFTGAIPFVGREVELRRLGEWLAGPKPIAVRCLTGRAGAGKTRLAIELCRRADGASGGVSDEVPGAPSGGWDAGFATQTEMRRFFGEKNLGTWGWGRPTLIVVDYAAALARDLRKWLEELALNPGRGAGPLRLLLLERTADAQAGWWAELTRVGFSEAGLLDLLDPSEPEALPPLPAEDRAALRSATLARAAPDKHGGPTAPAAQIVGDGEALDALMAGLAAARGLDVSNGAGVSRVAMAEALAKRERRRLDRLAETRGVEPPALAHMAAVLTLQGGADLDAALRAIEEEKAALGLEGAPRTLRTVLREALPAGEAGRLSAILPDLIGEAFVLAALATPELSEGEQTAVVGRAHGRAADATLASVIRTAQDFAKDDGHPSLRWLDTFAVRCTTPAAWLKLEQALPEQSVVLRQRAAKFTELALAALGTSPDGDDALWLLSEKAGLLNRLAFRRSELGDRKGALAAAEGAVELYRSVIKRGGKAYRPLLGLSLLHYGNSLFMMEKYLDALIAAEESKKIFWYIPPVDLRHHMSTRAFSLVSNLQANVLSELGYLKDAIDERKLAIYIRRTLADRFNGKDTATLASALLDYANDLCTDGRYKKALRVAEEAIRIYRQLYENAPDAYQSLLAIALNCYAKQLSANQRFYDALNIIREARDIHIAMAKNNFAAFGRDAVTSSINYANCLSQLSHTLEALESAEIAASYCRRLTYFTPVLFIPLLSHVLYVLSCCHESNGNIIRAIELNRDAIAKLEPFFGKSPYIHSSLMDVIYGHYIRQCEAAGVEPDEALLAPVIEVFERLRAAGGDETTEAEEA